MSYFDYIAYDNHGTKICGTIEAESKIEAKEKLFKKQLVIVKVSKQAESFKLPFFKNINKKIKLKELEFITSELAILLNSGVRLDKGLEILLRGSENEATRHMLSEIVKSVKSGKSLSEAFSEFPEIFDDLYINMIKLGEASGELDVVFSRLSIDLKFRRELQSKIVQSLTYPSVILFVCIACILFVFNYIVPQMSSIFDRNSELPVYTEILLSTSDWFVTYQWYLALTLLITMLTFYRALQFKKFRLYISELGLKLPLIGSAILLIERIRFNSSMSMMLSNGLSLIDSIRLSAGNVKNLEIQKSLLTVQSKLKHGGSLSDSLKSTPIFTEFNISLVEVGEESGQLSPVFDEVANRSRQDFESWTTTLTSMIEPLLILIMGAIVGSVVVVMLLSIVSTNDIAL